MHLLGLIATTKGFWGGSTGWITLLGVLLAVAGALGVAYAVFRSNMAMSTIELLRDNNEAQGKRLDYVEKENIQLKAQNDAQARRIEMLEDMVSGTKAIEVLSATLEQRHRELISALQGAGHATP